ncbi:MAG: ATP-binding cassette domain-containing protein [Crenarchaeota archaeon]|nr:ATP-binding cassette domain-containing protein [Thermoproteota archaeon]
MLKYSIAAAGYTEGQKIIEDVKGELGEGEILVLAGPSGSGKTTTILAITGVINNLLYGWVNGEVNLNGTNPLTPEGFEEIPGLIGAVLQDPDKQLVMPTPYDEVAFTLENLGYDEKTIRRKTIKTLKRFGLDEKMYSHVEDLSGGQKRRLTFASAVVHDPKLLILDEPSANVDPWGIREIRGFIQESRKKGRGVLIVEHKLRYFLWENIEIHVYRGGKQVAKLETPLSREEIKMLMENGIDAGPSRIIDVRGGRDKTVLEARSLTIGYSGNIVAENIDLRVEEGEAVAIIGRNGSGKTTLLKTLAGGLRELDGQIYINGKQLLAKERMRRVFYVPQMPDYLFVEQSLEAELREASKKTGTPLDELVELIPWYNMNKSTSPYRLSHGQRRWLGIVVAYAYKPSVILLDEPSTGLDLHLFKMLREAVEKLRMRGVSFIISTHDPRVIGEMCNRAYLLDGKRLHEINRYKAVEYLEKEAGLSLEEA